MKRITFNPLLPLLFTMIFISSICTAAYTENNLEINIPNRSINLTTDEISYIVVQVQNSNNTTEMQLELAGAISISGHLEFDVFCLQELNITLLPGEIVNLSLGLKPGLWVDTGNRVVSISITGEIGGIDAVGSDSILVNVVWSWKEWAIILGSLIAFVTIVLLILLKFGYMKKKVKQESIEVKNTCQTCGKTLGDVQYPCALWGITSRKCNQGPFCSEECLQKHVQTSPHR